MPHVNGRDLKPSHNTRVGCTGMLPIEVSLVLGRGRLRRQLQLLVEHLFANVLERLIDEWAVETAMHGPPADVGLESLSQPVERSPLVLPMDLLESDQALKAGGL